MFCVTTITFGTSSSSSASARCPACGAFLTYEAAPVVVPSPDPGRAILESLARRQLLRIVAFPEPLLSFPEGGDAAFLRHPGPGSSDDELRFGEGVDDRV